MKIVLTGATGFIGSHVLPFLLAEGHEVTALTRHPEKAARKFDSKIHFIPWQENQEGFSIPEVVLQEAQAVIHLAGESIINKRWSLKVKKEIIASRSGALKKLTHTFANAPHLKVFISASAIGFYGDRGDEELDESSTPGAQFLSEVCQKWEEALLKSPLHCRKIVLRLGLVLGENGGALKKMTPLFKLGLGGKIGNGQQWMSWIHVFDLVQMILFSLKNSEINGVLNAVSPHPIKNTDFTKTLSKVYHKPAFLNVPAFALKSVLGERSEALLSSQKVFPKKMLTQHFQFKYQTLKDALMDIQTKEMKI